MPNPITQNLKPAPPPRTPLTAPHQSTASTVNIPGKTLPNPIAQNLKPAPPSRTPLTAPHQSTASTAITPGKTPTPRTSPPKRPNVPQKHAPIKLVNHLTNEYANDYANLLEKKFSPSNVLFNTETLARNSMLIDLLNPNLEFYKQMNRSEGVLENLLALPEEQLTLELSLFNIKNSTSLTESDLRNTLENVKNIKAIVEAFNQEVFTIIQPRKDKDGKFIFDDETVGKIAARFSNYLDKISTPFFEVLNIPNFPLIPNFLTTPKGLEATAKYEQSLLPPEKKSSVSYSNVQSADKDLIQINNAILRYKTVLPGLSKTIKNTEHQRQVANCNDKLLDKLQKANVIRASVQYNGHIRSLAGSKLSSSSHPELRAFLKDHATLKPATYNSESIELAKRMLHQLTKSGISRMINDKTDNKFSNLVNLHTFFQSIPKNNLSKRELKELDRKIQKHTDIFVKQIEARLGPGLDENSEENKKSDTVKMYNTLKNLKSKSIMPA